MTLRMSPLGYKQTLAGPKTTSALHPGADLPGGVPVRLLLTQSGRRAQIGQAENIGLARGRAAAQRPT